MKNFCVYLLLFIIFLSANVGHAQILMERLSRNGVVVDSIRMAFVQGGTFDMGSNNHEEENPIHAVTVKSYYIGIYEITQEQWNAVMDLNFSDNQDCKKCPVDKVSWNEAQEFVTKLSVMSGKRYRLPTEAEWEYAARGGRRSARYLYSGSNNINDVAKPYYEGMPQYARRPYSAGLKRPNELGLYDMSGNVMEWCSDWYSSTYYQQRAADNPKGPVSGVTKVVRGGCYDAYPQVMTSTYRHQDRQPEPHVHWERLGFRVVREE